MTSGSPRPIAAEHGPLRVASLATGPLQENAVLVWDAASAEGFLIDPGDEAGRVLSWIMTLGVKVRAILLTHAHFDHIGAVQPLREALNVPVWLHERDLPLYRAGQQSAERWNLPFVQPKDPEHFIRPGSGVHGRPAQAHRPRTAGARAGACGVRRARAWRWWATRCFRAASGAPICRAATTPS